MGIIINNGNNQSNLQKRIAADLREKQSKKSAGGGKKPLVDKDDIAKTKTDFVCDSNYMHDFAKSSIPGWVWAFGFIIVIVIAALIANIILNSGGQR